MPKITIPCDCDDEEHEVDVEAEMGYGSSIGISSPAEDDKLPCGRALTTKDFERIVERLREWGVDEG